jgi:hypothetical protein
MRILPPRSSPPEDGKQVKHLEDFLGMLRAIPPGQKLKLKIIRDRRVQTLEQAHDR